MATVLCGWALPLASPLSCRRERAQTPDTPYCRVVRVVLVAVLVRVAVLVLVVAVVVAATLVAAAASRKQTETATKETDWE